MSDIRYKWHKVGDQSVSIRTVCYMGPHLLEHVESHYNGDKFVMASYVYLWRGPEKPLERIAELPDVELSSTSHTCLEDWYAMNVLFDDMFTGEDDGTNKQDR